MLKKIKTKLKKEKPMIMFGIFIGIFLISITLFWSSYHNLDLLSNYALIYSDFNHENWQSDSEFKDVREIRDCRADFKCSDYMTIYIYSKYGQFIAYILMMMLVLGFVEAEWRKKQNSQ